MNKYIKEEVEEEDGIYKVGFSATYVIKKEQVDEKGELFELSEEEALEKAERQLGEDIGKTADMSRVFNREISEG